MNSATKVAGFLAAIAAVFGLALGVGRAFGPVAEPQTVAHESHDLQAGADKHEPPGKRQSFQEE